MSKDKNRIRSGNVTIDLDKVEEIGIAPAFILGIITKECRAGGTVAESNAAWTPITYRQLSEASGLSIRRIQDIIKELEKGGHVRTTKARRKSGIMTKWYSVLYVADD